MRWIWNPEAFRATEQGSLRERWTRLVYLRMLQGAAKGYLPRTFTDTDPLGDAPVQLCVLCALDKGRERKLDLSGKNTAHFVRILMATLLPPPADATHAERQVHRAFGSIETEGQRREFLDGLGRMFRSRGGVA